MFAASSNQAQANIQDGQELADVSAEGLGFLAIAGEAKLQLLPSSWPSSNLPKPTSSLLTVCSREGLLAAAGPDTLILGSTQSIREAFTSNASTANTAVPFTPQLQISIPRVSQVAFSSNDKYLTICADEGGGLAVYEVASLKSGKTEPAFQIATNGVPVRALVPNPNEEFGRLHAIILQDGKLLLADLVDHILMPGKNGPVLRENVSCVSWSAKGKQLVAGLGDGTAVQLTWDGEVKAVIPKPSVAQDNHHISSMMWLNNDTFFIVYTPATPESVYVLMTREPKTTNFHSQVLTQPISPMGMERSPPHHFLQRLRDFPPNMTDALFFASTTSVDIGLITNSKTPLSSGPDAASSVGQYHFTEMADDSRRAAMPMSDGEDTSPIGLTMDLSSREEVRRPIRSDETLDASKTPLPLLMALNNEGVLTAWWFVYDESVRQGIAYPGLVAVAGNAPIQQSSTPQQASSGVGGFQSSTTNNFGTPKPSFGAPSRPAFGASSGLGGGNQSPWGSTPQSTAQPQTSGMSLGKPAFGSSTPFGASAFGQSGGLGNNRSIWGTSGNQAQNNPLAQTSSMFGGGNNQAASPFAQVSKPQTSGASPFASAASGASPFGNLGTPQGGLFGQKTSTGSGLNTAPSFGSTITIGSSMDSSFGKPSAFGNTPSLSKDTSEIPTSKVPAAKEDTGDADMMDDETSQTRKVSDSEGKSTESKPSGLFGLGSSGFKLGSQFTQNAPSKADDSKADVPSLFGADFGGALESTRKTKELEPKTGSESGQKAPTESDSSGAGPSKTKQAAGSDSTDGTRSNEEEKKIKIEDESEAPLPPDPTEAQLKEAAKPIPRLGVSSKSAPAPAPKSAPEPESDPKQPALPPSPVGDEESAEPSPAGSPPIDLGDFGEEPSSPLSPPSHDTKPKANETPQNTQRITSAPAGTTPQWSFGDIGSNRNPLNNLSSTTAMQAPETNRSTSTFTFGSKDTTPNITKPPVLFGFPDHTQQTPRSPSPVRQDQTSPTLGSPRRIRSPSPRRSSQQVSKAPAQPSQNSTSTPTAPPPFRQPSLAQNKVRTSSTSRLDTVPETSVPLPKQTPSAAYQDTTDFSLDNNDDDEQIAEDLASEPPSLREIPPFLAHQDYVSHVQGDALPAQIERLYRDINSMIDTLGLNARSLKSFVKGHQETPDEGKLGDQQRDWLEKPPSWVLDEIYDLGIVQKDLVSRLDANRIQNPGDKIKEIQNIRRAVAKLRARNSDYAHRITLADSESDHPDAVKAREAPLGAEQTAQLYEIRSSYASVTRQLSEAEDAIAMLRVKIVNAAAAKGEAVEGAGGQVVPTVEAIVNTISKMTRMAEEKRSDIDVLEARLKRLEYGTQDEGEELSMSRLSLGASTASRRQGSSSPFDSTPSKVRGKRSNFNTPQKNTRREGSFGLEFSDEEDEFEDARSRGTPAGVLKSSLRSSTRSTGGRTGLENSMAMIKVEDEDEKVADMRKKIIQRKRIIGSVRRILEKKNGAD